MLREALALAIFISVTSVVLFTPVRHLHSPSCILLFWLAKLGLQTGQTNNSTSSLSILCSRATYIVIAGNCTSRNTEDVAAHQQWSKLRGGGRPPGGSKKRAKAKKAGEASAAARKGAGGTKNVVSLHMFICSGDAAGTELEGAAENESSCVCDDCILRDINAYFEEYRLCCVQQFDLAGCVQFS